jgi:hypothetical protein
MKYKRQHKQSCNIVNSFFIISLWKGRNNIELQRYLRLDRRQKYSCDAKASINQREQYRDTVHLFIGTRHSL